MDTNGFSKGRKKGMPSYSDQEHPPTPPNASPSPPPSSTTPPHQPPHNHPNLPPHNHHHFHPPPHVPPPLPPPPHLPHHPRLGATHLSTYLNTHPTLKSLITRIDLSHQINQPLHHRRHRPFLHLTRVGTLDDGFFSSDSEFDRSLLNPLTKSVKNESFLILSKFYTNLGFSDRVIDNGIVVNNVFKDGGVSFKVPFELYESTIEFRDGHLAEFENSESKDGEIGSDDDGDMVDLRFLLGLRMSRRDAASFFHLIGFLTAVYGYMIVSYVVTYTWIYGIVFLRVVEDVLGRYNSVFRTLWDGSGIGMKRLARFMLMKWAARDALSQVVGIYFFAEVEDQYSIFKVLVRMKLMPFSDVSLLIKGNERESVGFILTWFFVELVVGFLFAVDSWVAIVDSRKSRKAIMKEGCDMLAMMLFPSLEIKCWEAMACGTFTRWMLEAAGGELFALVFQSCMEIYFMVAWLVFYVASRHKEATMIGRTFGQQELEGFLEGIR